MQHFNFKTSIHYTRNVPMSVIIQTKTCCLRRIDKYYHIFYVPYTKLQIRIQLSETTLLTSKLYWDFIDKALISIFLCINAKSTITLNSNSNRESTTQQRFYENKQSSFKYRGLKIRYLSYTAYISKRWVANILTNTYLKRLNVSCFENELLSSARNDFWLILFLFPILNNAIIFVTIYENLLWSGLSQTAMFFGIFTSLFRVNFDIVSGTESEIIWLKQKVRWI